MHPISGLYSTHHVQVNQGRIVLLHINLGSSEFLSSSHHLTKYYHNCPPFWKQSFPFKLHLPSPIKTNRQSSLEWQVSSLDGVTWKDFSAGLKTWRTQRRWTEKTGPEWTNRTKKTTKWTEMSQIETFFLK